MKKIFCYLKSKLTLEEKVYPYECIPKYLKKKLEKTLFSCLFLFLLFIVMAFSYQDSSYVLFAFIMFFAGIGMSGSLYYESTRDHIKEVSGVIIYTERQGYRKQKKSLHVQDDSGNVYSIYVTELKNKVQFRNGNKIIFYVKTSLLRYEDGLYWGGYPIIVKRLDAKIA